MISRRNFIQVTLLGGGSLALGITSIGCGGGAQWPQPGPGESLRPNMYLTLEPNGQVILDLNKSEMGQGVMTSHAMLVAEELEVPLGTIKVRFAKADPMYRTSFGMQQTGGSTSVAEHYVPLRQAAAAAREMLIGAAAKSWGLKASSLKAENGAVVAPSGERTPYGELLAGAAKQPVPESPRIKKPSEFQVIGKSMRRNDARMKTDGTAQFGIDAEVPNMVRAYMIHPPVYGAEAKSVSADKARNMPGVVDVISFERGVAVIAEKYWQAKRAAATVEVEWKRGLVAGLNSDVIRKAAKAYAEPGATVVSNGDVDAALTSKNAAKVLDVTYEVPYLTHAPMEPQNAIAQVRKDGKVELWGPFQGQTVVQEVVSRLVGIGRSDVIVHTTFLGGGFGRRGMVDYAVEAVMLALRVKRPVQVIWSRESDTRGGYYRPISLCKAKGAVDAQGNPTAWSYHLLSQSIFADQADFLASIFPDWMLQSTRQIVSRTASALGATNTLPDPIALEGAAGVPYDIENRQVSFTPINTRMPVAFWRSVGHSYNGFFVESFIDELAHAGGSDPVAFRRKLLAKHPRHLGVLELAAKKAGWGSPAPAGMGRGVAVHESFGSFCAQVVEAGIVDGEVKVKRVVAAIDCGIVINPDIVKSQIESSVIYGLSAALYQQITFVDGQVQQGNFDDYPALRMYESPEIEVHIVESEQDPTGVGEPGLPPIAAALTNALYAAHQIRLRRLPLVVALAESDSPRDQAQMASHSRR